MKKFLFLVGAILPMLVNAQVKGFEPQVKVSYEQGIDSDKNKSFGADFVAAYRFSETFRLGGGIGVFWCEHLFEPSTIISGHYYKEYREAACYFPIFTNGKINFIKTGKWRPYLSIDLGYAIYKPFSKYAEENRLGIFVKPAFGVDCQLGKGAIFMELGYKYQDRKFQDEMWGYSQLAISLGYQF